MAANIVLTGLASNDPVPGNYLEINFAQGDASLGQGEYAVLFIGNMTSAGSATAGVVYGPLSNPPLASDADAATLFGGKSELRRMIKRFLAVNPFTPIYAVAVADPAGTAATRDHVIANAATGDGNLRLFFADDYVDTAIASGDAAGAIATAAVANFNAVAAARGWAATASVVTTTTVRITAAQTGPRGNWLRSAALITAGIATTVSNSTPGFLSSGATADSNSTALAAIAAYRYYYIVSAAADATQLGALVTQVNSQASPLTGIRQRVFAGHVDSLANGITLATGRNTARAEIGICPEMDVPPEEIAAHLAGVYSLFERGFPFRTNFAGFGNDTQTQPYWTLPAPRSGAAMTRAQIASALNNGLTPIGVNANKTTYLVDRVTTRSITNGTPDYRIRPAHKVTICDRYADDVLAKFALQFGGKKIGNDPLPGQRPPGKDVVTPRVVKAALNGVTRAYADADMVQNVDEIIANTISQRDTSPTTRISNRVPLQTIDNLTQTATAVDQVA